MKLLRNSLFKTFLLALFLMAPGNVLAQSSASLDRLVSQIESMFPPLEGYVIAVDGSGLTLDLRQGMAVKKGDRLKLIRYGRDLFHPVTKKKVGRKETDLGEVEVLEVRNDYSLARGKEWAEKEGAGHDPRSIPDLLRNCRGSDPQVTARPVLGAHHPWREPQVAKISFHRVSRSLQSQSLAPTNGARSAL